MVPVMIFRDPGAVSLRLDALRDWAVRADQLASDRADLMAAAWRAGGRNVAELGRSAGVSRDTVCSDLRSRGIDPRNKHGD